MPENQQALSDTSLQSGLQLTIENHMGKKTSIARSRSQQTQ
jgi:hypothetical protein